MKRIGLTKAVWLFVPKGIAKTVDAGALKSEGAGAVGNASQPGTAKAGVYITRRTNYVR